MQIGRVPFGVSMSFALHRNPHRGSPLNAKWKLVSRNMELGKLDQFPLLYHLKSVFSPKSKFSLDAVMKSLYSNSCILFPLNYGLRLNSGITYVPGWTEDLPVTSWSPLFYKNYYRYNGRSNSIVTLGFTVWLVDAGRFHLSWICAVRTAVSGEVWYDGAWHVSFTLPRAKWGQ